MAKEQSVEPAAPAEAVVAVVPDVAQLREIAAAARVSAEAALTSALAGLPETAGCTEIGALKSDFAHALSILCVK